jgi:hypothetical protein
VVPSLEPKAIVANLAERRLTLGELLASYRGVRDLSGLSLRDPGPVLALAAEQLRSLADWIVRRISRRLRRS